MTQVKSAQDKCLRVALRGHRDPRTLAQKRADLQAQINAMALSDLAQVSARLKSLHKELERKEGRRWTHYQLADAMKIAPRTFQSWENGEVENRDGKGYEKMARWYSRKLGRKITKQWIVFGEEGAEATEDEQDLMGALNNATNGNNNERLTRIEALIARNSEAIERILELLERRDAELAEDVDTTGEPGERRRREQEQAEDD